MARKRIDAESEPTLTSDRSSEGSGTQTVSTVSSMAVTIERIVPRGVGLLAERYRLGRFLAAGGMGEVYEAEDLLMGQIVAIKAVRGDRSGEPEAIERLRREVQLARLVNHPNVCRVFDLGTHEGTLFISMELLRGRTLAAHLADQGALSVDEAREIVSGVAEAVAAAHARGIVHRDLKPSNVILVPGERGALRPVVTDFGIARWREDRAGEEHATLTGTDLVGSPSYMAPEQLTGDPITPATDVYALGVMMYELVSGRRPFVAESRIATATLRLTQRAPRLRQVAPDVDARWEALTARCLERDPAARPADAAVLLARLGGGGRRRRRRRWWLAGLLAAATVAASFWIAWTALAPEPVPALPPPSAAHPPPAPDVDQRIRRLGVGRYTVDRRLLQAISADPDAYVRGFRMVPFDSFPLDGVRVDDVQTGSLADRLGFRSGDAIYGVDDVSVRDLASARDALAQMLRLEAGQTARIIFFRQGVPMWLVLTAVDAP